MHYDLRDTDRHEPPAHEVGEGCEPPAERDQRQGFWSSIADVLLSMPAGIGIRIGG